MGQSEEYPSRCFGDQVPIARLVHGKEITIRGRVIQLSSKQVGVLADETGRVSFRFASAGSGLIDCGDIVELRGHLRGDAGEFTALETRVLARSLRDYREGDWQRFHDRERSLIKNIQLRSKVLASIRSFFAAREFIEVETPYMLEALGQEVHIESFKTTFKAPDSTRSLYLATSPELHMKRMLGGGVERIYQIARCFRNGECTPMHNPEFTMVEWYRAYASYEEIMADTEALIAHVIDDVYEEQCPDFLSALVAGTPWPKITVNEAFLKWAGIDLKECTDANTFLKRARDSGFASAATGDSWDDLFHKVLLEKIEPELATFAAVFLLDYPEELAALAKRKEGVPSVAERAEAYICGVELANGYTELNDPVEQRRRFEEARTTKANSEELDEDFLRVMECAMPPAGGMALGVDRLIMLLAGSREIEEVLSFPYRP